MTVSGLESHFTLMGLNHNLQSQTCRNQNDLPVANSPATDNEPDVKNDTAVSENQTVANIT